MNTNTVPTNTVPTNTVPTNTAANNRRGGSRRSVRRIAFVALSLAAAAGISGVGDAAGASPVRDTRLAVADAGPVRPDTRLAAPDQPSTEKKIWEYDCVAIHGAGAGYHALQTCIKDAKEMCGFVDEGTFKHESYGKVSCHK